LSSARQAVFAADGSFSGWAGRPDWHPPALSEADRGAVAEAVRYYGNVVLAPGDPLEISGRIAALLAHWRDRDDLHEAVRDQVARDWLAILGRFPLWAVCEAALEYFEFNRHRPQIADIRLLCDRAIEPERRRLALLRRALDPPASE
jgi:hypothetical protein